jgi:hypothetical protein
LGTEIRLNLPHIRHARLKIAAVEIHLRTPFRRKQFPAVIAKIEGQTSRGPPWKGHEGRISLSGCPINGKMAAWGAAGLVDDHVQRERADE